MVPWYGASRNGVSRVGDSAVASLGEGKGGGPSTAALLLFKGHSRSYFRSVVHVTNPHPVLSASEILKLDPQLGSGSDDMRRGRSSLSCAY